EALLQRVQRRAVGETFNGQNLMPVGLNRKHGARLHRAIAVHDDDTATTVRCVAPDVRAGQAAVVPEKICEQLPRLNIAFERGAVDREADSHTLTPSRSKAWRRPRATSTPARLLLYGILPRKSACGALFFDAASAAARIRSAFGF